MKLSAVMGSVGLVEAFESDVVMGNGMRRGVGIIPSSGLVIERGSGAVDD